MKRDQLIHLWRSLSTTGLTLGTLFFAVSLTPSLLPRTFVTQGILSGCAFGSGYLLGVFFYWLWHYLEFREPGGQALRTIKRASLTIGILTSIAFLWHVTSWQNSIHQLFQLELVTSAHPFKIAVVASATGLVLLTLGRLFRILCQFVAAKVNRIMPRRVSNVIGILAAILLFWSVINGLVFRGLLRAADSSYRQFDELMEPERIQPTDPLKTGSSTSLIKWEELGRMGRSYIASGPGRQDLHPFAGDKTREPLRVYVGIRSRETVQERAQLALAELKRVGGFERSMLIVITPTGTGWVDPSAINSVEYLHGGDVASVAMQYSYLSSPLSLFVEPDYGAEAARALFAEVYDYWTTLPHKTRPKLYLFGLSLGALHSEQSTDFFDVMSDPPHGALWSGPPFLSSFWTTKTAKRNPSSPAWLPRVRDDRFVRFLNQDGAAVPEKTPWGPTRIVYLQYASDPITFFEYRVLWQKLPWMSAPRGPDVSPQFRWYPVVTFLQLAMDIAAAPSSTMGHGHVYAPEHYFNAWLDVSGPAGHSPEEIKRIRTHLATR